MPESEWKLIPVEKVPKGRKHNPQRDWDEIFAGIPHGKALVLDDKDLCIDTPRQALRRRQDKGKLLEYYITQKKIKGVVCVYIARR